MPFVWTPEGVISPKQDHADQLAKDTIGWQSQNVTRKKSGHRLWNISYGYRLWNISFMPSIKA